MAAIGAITIGLAAWFLIRVEKGVAPGATEETSYGVRSADVPELDRQVVLEGLTNVWDVGFLPDDTMIFTERAGTISKLDGSKKTVIATVPNIYAKGEGGLLGMVVDPDFANNRFIYACYDTAQDVRVGRWKVNAETTSLSDYKDIVTGMPAKSLPSRHSGCRPRFGADGFLWIGTGDVAVGTNPQDPKSLGGKVLRVDRDGKAAPGNLSEPFDPRIHSYGHRNVQGLAMLSSAKYGVYGFSVEHGSSRDDEVNPLKSGNMGWNPVPDYNESVPMTDKLKYPDAITPLWQSGEPTIAPSGATFLIGSKWKAFDGRIAMAVLKGKHLRILELDDSGNLKSENSLFNDEFGRIRSAVMGPFNNLYLTTDNGSGQDKIIRISPR